jgi:serine/threonine protein kinase
MLNLLRVFLICLFCVFSVNCVEEGEDHSHDSFVSMFMNSISGLFGWFQYKKIEKSKDVPIVHPDPASSGKFLTENLRGDMMTLLHQNKISDPKAGKLLAILENIEAIEINLKMANEYEYRANKLCSLYFPKIDKILADDSNSGLSTQELLEKYVSKFSNNNFEQSDSSGLFVTKELSRNSNFEEDKKMMEFVIGNLNEVLKKDDNEHHLAAGSFSNVYTLPDDDSDIDFPKKVLKVMNFKDNYYEEMKNKVINDEPILDLILLMVRHKRSFFEQVLTEIEVNARTNNFMRVYDNDISGNDPSDNSDFVNFFGCLNIRWKLNYRENPSFKALQKIKQSYIKQIENPSNIRDLKFEDLEDIIDNEEIDLTLQGMSSSVDEVPIDYKIKVLNHFFWDLNLYEDYQFIAVFERMDLDLFDDIFQKMYFMGASSLGERLTFYSMIAKKVFMLHELGYIHCDLKSSNFLYRILPKNGSFTVVYDNFRLIDFGSVQLNSRFCKGGTLGYLAPEVENPLKVAHDDSDFIELINNMKDFSNFHESAFENYEQFVQFLLTKFEISVPEDYLDFRTVIENGSFNRPETFHDWVQLLTQLSGVFESINMITKVDYKPQPDDLVEGSNKLVLLTENKAKFGISGKEEEKQLLLRTQDLKKNKQEFIVRTLKRERLREGKFDYDPEVIHNLNKADTFSLGIFFNEVETALNTNSIFEMFKKVQNEDLTEEVFQKNLIDPINNTFKLKKGRNGLKDSMIEEVQEYFKDSSDMKVSYNQYSSEYKLIFGKQMNDFGNLLQELNDFIVKMVSYRAYERPSMKEVLQKFAELNEKLEKLKNQNKPYQTKINIINRKVRNTISNFIKDKYKSIYGHLRLLI